MLLVERYLRARQIAAADDRRCGDSRARDYHCQAATYEICGQVGRVGV